MSCNHEQDALLELVKTWETEQLNLQKMVVCENNEISVKLINNSLRYIGGLDISYRNENTSDACGCLVVYDQKEKKVIYSNTIDHFTTIPYIPCFLGYRERKIYTILLNRLKETSDIPFPEVLLVDGQGRLHPRHFGSACMIGLDFNVPTIGVAKTLLCGSIYGPPQFCDGESTFVDVALDLHDCIKTIRVALDHNIQSCDIVHNGEVIAKSYCLPGNRKPIYVSVGHLLSLDQAVEIVRKLCIYRIPEPIRFADRLSRDHLEDALN